MGIVKPEITLARMADAREIAALRTAVAQHMTARFGEGHWSAIPSRAEVIRQMRASQVLVARLDQQLVGTVRLATVNAHSMKSAGFTPVASALYVIGMSVTPEYGRMGVGRALLDAAKDAAHSRRAAALWVDTYAGAAGAGPFYLRCGFRQAGTVYYEWLADPAFS
jgi:GNAT superfamily N-acetyltransferase